MDSADHMDQSIGLAVATIRDTDTALFDDPSPCAGYTVRDVVNHLAFGFLLARRSGAREPWDPAWSAADRTPYLGGLPDGEWARACADEAAATARAWADPAAWEGEASMGGAPMPAALIGAMMTAEFAVHAWDLAVATGRAVEVPDGLATVVLEGVSAMAPAGREGGWFGAEVAVPGDAPAFERALAASGRDPRWTP
ncbi:TIGR03086 family metal-binding protein [Pseudonocardia sp. MH-G8]|uniref:TIGR03086 family metal-binding protein n=1 Tax=Pseudonocardia sp. MH-G8 TaxID=1854588 RepID=UPI000BA0D3E5|nr:TIGR03086 family metal-binding protein [Pseudonocardia sp. MH-G8]OZM79028.1 TIGR03086 family protein [Pseudonocardia sp. MH-G8]